MFAHLILLFLTTLDSSGRIKYLLVPLMTGVNITSEYHTISHSGTYFDPKYAINE